MSPKHPYTFHIDPELDAALKALKARDGIPEAETIRRALVQYFEVKGIRVETKAARPRVSPRKRA